MTKSIRNSIMRITTLIGMILLFGTIAFAQPRGRYIYSGSYDYNAKSVSKQTAYKTLYVTPYSSPSQIWLKVVGVTNGGQRYNLPSNSGRYIYSRNKSGYSIYEWDEQCIIVNSRQNVIQYYRDIRQGKYDEFILSN